MLKGMHKGPCDFAVVSALLPSRGLQIRSVRMLPYVGPNANVGHKDLHVVRLFGRCMLLFEQIWSGLWKEVPHRIGGRRHPDARQTRP